MEAVIESYISVLALVLKRSSSRGASHGSWHQASGSDVARGQISQGDTTGAGGSAQRFV